MKFDQPKLTGLYEGRKNCGRSATGGKIFNGSAENEKIKMRSGFNESYRQDYRDIASR
jgi:hypothetical protein